MFFSLDAVEDCRVVLDGFSFLAGAVGLAAFCRRCGPGCWDEALVNGLLAEAV